MNRRSEEADRRNSITGARLKKAIEDKGITQAELLRQASSIATGYFDMSAPALNQIVNCKRPLHYEDAELFASILGVTPGYLMGAEESEVTKQVLAWEKEARKYNALLNQISANIFGYSNKCTTSEEIQLESYGVVYTPSKADREIYSIKVNDMESFHNDVCSYIKKRFEVLIEISEREA